MFVMFQISTNWFLELNTFEKGFPGGSDGKEFTCSAGDPGSIPGLGRSPEEGTHSSILAWRIPWAEEPDGLQPMGSQRIGHDWVTNSFHLWNNYLKTCINEAIPYQPLPNNNWFQGRSKEQCHYDVKTR